MKILTTQNLNSLSTEPSTSVSTKNKRLKNSYFSLPDSYDEISFKGKGDAAKKLSEAIRKAEIIKKIERTKAAGEKSMKEKILDHGFFDGLLDLMAHETFIQAAISFLICVFLRPLTIMSLPTKKSKEDNKYASAHSMSSGFVGLASSLLIAIPFSKGLKYAQNNYIEQLGEKTLKNMYPHLKIESITDPLTKKRLPMKKWLNFDGKPFSKDMKNPMLMARPIHATEISEKTFNLFGINLDAVANKNKPFAEWVDKDGKRVVEKLDIKDFCIAVKEEGMGGTLGKNYKDTNFFSLKYIKDDLLEAACKDLDINSTKGASGERLHPIYWKNKDGKAYTDIFESTHLSSFTETSESVPLFSSNHRIETKSGAKKYTALQSNIKYDSKIGVPEKIGSEITQDSLNADAITDIQSKLIIWLPDVISRPLVATTTIALLPKILKNVFHMEKPKKVEVKPEIKEVVESNNIKLVNASGKEVA